MAVCVMVCNRSRKEKIFSFVEYYSFLDFIIGVASLILHRDDLKHYYITYVGIYYCYLDRKMWCTFSDIMSKVTSFLLILLFHKKRNKNKNWSLCFKRKSSYFQISIPNICRRKKTERATKASTKIVSKIIIIIF